ncbi:MAG: hypothetical protein LBI80_06050 [Endomicrobium sp.]|jgi:hypothetical protein|nr:hypothetical protein [Endomicrobium sp.]
MRFSINEAFKFSFQIFKENWTKLLNISLFSIVLMIMLLYFMSKYLLIHFDILSLVTIPKNIILFVFFKNISLLMPAIFLFCVTSTILPVFYGSKVQFKNYFLDAEKVINFMCGMLLLVLVPSILTLVSYELFSKFDDGSVIFTFFLSLYMVMSLGIFVYLCRYLLFYIDVLKGQSIIKSLKKSARLLKGNLYKFVALIVLLYFINVVGVLSVVGGIFVLPLNALVLAHVYMQLTKSNEDITQKNA